MNQSINPSRTISDGKWVRQGAICATLSDSTAHHRLKNPMHHRASNTCSVFQTHVSMCAASSKSAFTQICTLHWVTHSAVLFQLWCSEDVCGCGCSLVTLVLLLYYLLLINFEWCKFQMKFFFIVFTRICLICMVLCHISINKVQVITPSNSS